MERNTPSAMRSALARIGVRQRHGQIGQGHAAQPGQREIEQMRVAPRQPVGDRERRIRERVQNQCGEPVFERVAQRERWRMNSSFYPSAAENQIAVVEDRALAGRDGALRLIKMHLNSGGLGSWMERSRGGFVLIADLHLCSRGRQGARARKSS